MTGKAAAIDRDLRARIEDGTYPVGGFLPSEHQLATSYGASRETVRRALQELTEDGWIQKITGRGSKVLERSHYVFPVTRLLGYKEFSLAEGLDLNNRVLAVEQTMLPVAAFAGLRDGGARLEPVPVTHVARLRVIDGEPVIIDHDYLVTALAPGITEQVAQDSLYDHLEGTLGLSLGYSVKEIRVVPADDEDCRLLGLDASDVVVTTPSITSLEDTADIQFTVSRHRADRFRFRDFARRRPEERRTR